MSWQFVFNSRNLLSGSDRSDAIKLAYQSKYSFIAFNGIVYFIKDADTIYDTGIKTSDLF
jgi:hypothetical protein